MKKLSRLSLAQRQALRRNFLAELGENVPALLAALELSRDVCINMKDATGRIMVLNRRNCEVCNIRSELDAVGKRSTDLFAPPYADTYMALDREALLSEKPILNRVTAYPADRSPDFMVSHLFRLKNRRGEVIGTLHAYRLTRDTERDAQLGSKMRKVATYIDEHAREPLRLADLAHSIGMSETTFRRSFRTFFGTSAGAAILAARIRSTLKPLRETDLPIRDIAATAGFFDQSHFTRLFKRERGLTPYNYRLLNRRRHRDQ